MEVSFAPEAKGYPGLVLMSVTEQDCKGSGWNVGIGLGPLSAGINGSRNKCKTKVFGRP